jgi:methylglutaconyl-CoA hydratase
MSTQHDYENIVVEGDIVVMVTLNRPDIHNPFDEKTIAELTACFSDIQRMEDVRVVVITGAGNSFCAGGDLNWMKRMASLSREENVADAEGLSKMFEALDGIPVPTIARVNGAAFGGGCGLVCACDFAIASEQAKLALSEVKVGLLPGVISAYVIDRIGVKRSVQLFTSGERLNAVRALEMGMVDRVVPVEALGKAVDELVDLIMSGGPQAVKICKKLALVGGRMDRESFKRYSIEAIADARASAEGKEGVSSFLEKREPSWRKNSEYR